MPNSPGVPASLIIERLMPHPPEKIWRALTESRLIAQWLMRNDFALDPGHRFQFRADPVPHWDGIIDCEVLVVEPLRKLSYSWSTMGASFIILWSLTPQPAGTHLRMEQSGFSPNMHAAYQGATYGWQKFIGNLDRVAGGLES